jgi:hypothetical protein
MKGLRKRIEALEKNFGPKEPICILLTKTIIGMDRQVAETRTEVIWVGGHEPRDQHDLSKKG